MAKKSYPSLNQSPQTTAQVNPTYNGKEIPSKVTTTGGDCTQSEQSLKTSTSKRRTKSKKA